MKNILFEEDNSNQERRTDKVFLTMEEMSIKRKEYPPTKYLYGGIKERTFGVVFGPSKSGKSIFCENLGMSLAIGKKEFLGVELDGRPRKVLFVSLEEFWINRVDRYELQKTVVSNEEFELLKDNYLVPNISFNKYIISEEDWSNLREIISATQSEVVIIDSLTRLNPGELEKAKDAEKIIKQLRSICYDFKITLIVIHHTRKNINQTLTIDSMKGSSVFSQETDFAIGIASTSKKDRYIKNVYYRYYEDDDDLVTAFNISDKTWINNLGLVDEDDLLAHADRRVVTTKHDYLINYFLSDPDKTFTTAEIMAMFSTGVHSKSERTINYHLKELENKEIIEKKSIGMYKLSKTLNELDNEKIEA